MGARGSDESRRVQQEILDEFLRLKEELERARQLLYAHALPAEKSLGLVMQFDGLRRGFEELRQCDKDVALRQVPPFTSDGTVDPQAY